jgi:hypothetical protein
LPVHGTRAGARHGDRFFAKCEPEWFSVRREWRRFVPTSARTDAYPSATLPNGPPRPETPFQPGRSAAGSEKTCGRSDTNRHALRQDASYLARFLLMQVQEDAGIGSVLSSSEAGKEKRANLHSGD